MGAKTQALGKRLLALTGAIALGATALFGSAAAANAEVELGNIEFDREASISIHKRTQPNPAGTPASGLENPNAGGLPLNGVEFTIQRVGIDLTDPDVWETLDDLTYDSANPPTFVGDAIGPRETEGDGTVYFGGTDNLTPGVYLVTEGTDNGDNNIVTPAQPFFVVIPFSPEGETDWIYDVHVYPKNTTGQEHTKVLNLAQDAITYLAGEPVIWDLSATVPATGEDVTSLSITDELDDRLTFVSITDVSYPGVTFTAADWSVTPNPAPGTGGETVVFSLTQTGLDKLNDATAGQKLTLKLNTEVNATELTIDNGEIINGSTLEISEVKTESTPDTTYWGLLNVLKVDGDNKQPLEGSKFQLFKSEADAEAGTNPIIINGVGDEATPFETNDAGEVVFGPLNAGADNSRNYYLKEIEAPAGYVLDTENNIHEIEITSASITATYTVDNNKQPDIDLPLTGANGTWMFILGGVGLVAIATGIALRSRRAHA